MEVFIHRSVCVWVLYPPVKFINVHQGAAQRGSVSITVKFSLFISALLPSSASPGGRRETLMDARYREIQT